jgi:LmbE family N-acetylglucosaminyl deacetylase
MAGGSARARLRVVHRALLARLARDITTRTTRRTAVVVAPHPDDETLGCGATIIRKAAAGTRVLVVVVSDGGSRQEDGEIGFARRMACRQDECRLACGRLGVTDDNVEFLGFEDGALEHHVPAIEGRLHEIIERFEPEEVFAPTARDAHADHRAVALVIDRLRVGPLKNVDVFAYPVWYWNRWAWTDSRSSGTTQLGQLILRPVWHMITCHPRRVDAHDIVEQKRYALDAHQSQVGAPESDGTFLDPKWLKSFLRSDEIFFAVQEPSRP